MNEKIPYREDPLGIAAAPGLERCRAFLDRYSDYRDGLLDDEGWWFFRGHMAACGRCRRYDRVIRKGVDALRKMSWAPPRRRLTVAEVRRLAAASEPEPPASGTAGAGLAPTAAVLATLLVTAAAWSPFYSGHVPEVRMPPVAAADPPAPTAPPSSPSGPAVPPESRRDEPEEVVRSVPFEFGPGQAGEADGYSDPD